jgi:hypothetical protein
MVAKHKQQIIQEMDLELPDSLDLIGTLPRDYHLVVNMPSDSKV